MGKNKSSSGMKIGFEVGGVVDWGGQLIFKDVMKMSRLYLVVDAKRPPGFLSGYTRMQIPEGWIGMDGYPVKVPFKVPGFANYIRPTIPVAIDTLNVHPAGNYTLRFRGKGRIVLTGDSRHHTVEGSGGDTEYKFLIRSGVKDIFSLDIMESDQDDHIRDIRITLPGFENDSRDASPFYPPYMKGLAGASVLRFVGNSFYGHFGEIEPRPLVRWRERRTPGYRTQARYENANSWQGSGLALEYMVEMANQTNADLWLCTGHQWDDDYITRAAVLIRDTLDRKLKVWVEYSNETWSNWYVQGKYVVEKAIKKGFTTHPGDEGHHWTVHRSIQVWEIFKRAFGGYNRVLKVLGGDFKNYHSTKTRLECLENMHLNPESTMPDFLGLSVFLSPGQISEDDNISSIYRRLRKDISNCGREAKKFEDMAIRKGISLACYHGTMDIQTQDMESFSLARAAVEGHEIHNIYMKYLSIMENRGFQILIHPYTGIHGFYGFLNALEYTTENPNESSARYRALQDYISGNRISI